MRNSICADARVRGGFVLLEVMLATALFCVAVVGLARVIDQGVDLVTQMRWEARIRTSLESRLAELRAMRLEPMHEVEDADTDGVTYESEVVELELENQDGRLLSNLYLASVRARWEEAHGEQERLAEIYVYQP
jgi:Tfp pilus assembly protein PilV